MGAWKWLGAVRAARDLIDIRDEAVRIRNEAVLLRRQSDLLIGAAAVKYKAEIEDLKRMALASQRSYLSLAIIARAALDDPEQDIREDLDDLIESLGDNIARIEEHAVF